MRKRTSHHEPAPGSIEIEVSGRKVKYFPGSIVANAAGGRLDVHERLRRVLGEAETASDGRHVNMIASSLWTFLLWDDPDIEWCTDLDPDALLFASDEEFLKAGMALAREFLSIQTARLFRLEDLLEAIPVAIGHKDPAPGEVTPHE